jgi:membrane-bound metal-dependent hydrolase YbcI (DUF457 family)
MPSPIGHALGGLAAAWVVENATRARAVPEVRLAVVFAVVAAAPDLDLLIGAHRGPTHGLGSAAIAWAVAYGLTRRGRLSLAIAAAWASHAVLDWMSADSSAPIGSMILWPASREFYQADFHPFTAISRRYWLPGFWRHNILAVVREVAILFPVLVVAALWKWRIVTTRQG